ncbi:MAG: hypothetical protein KTR24_13855 [Saprospiraceae bacterium]|nr:hypothetical protein [Saprospiraceae bacterium]
MLSDTSAALSFLRSREGLQNEKHLYLFDRSMLHSKLQELRDAFPKAVKHCVAIKTQNAPEVLTEIASAGFGLEAASMEEVELAIHAGVPAHKIVFDSPVKTMEEIMRCEEAYPGIMLNANSLAELHRMKDLKSIAIGLRLNPQTQATTHPLLQTSGRSSKFGVPMADAASLLTLLGEVPRLDALHVHVGSSIAKVKGMVAGVKQVYDFAQRVNVERRKNGRPMITKLDIGGGLAPEKRGGVCLREYVSSLNAEIPSLFKDFEIVTEFGQYIHYECGTYISRIEYVSEDFIYVHGGADLFLRKVYSGLELPFVYAVTTGQLELKADRRHRYSIAGPLCFEGDVLDRAVPMPVCEPGDYLFISDVGANTVSMWSGHCSRERVKVVLF